MDTNLLLGAPLPLLAALARLGHTLRVSINGMEERLSRAADGEIESLRRRLRNVAPYIDPEQPIVPQGGPLFARLGIRDPNPAVQHRDDAYNAMLPERWRTFVSDDELSDWQTLASGMKLSIDRSASFVRDAHGALNATPRDGVTYDQVRAAVARDVSESHPVARRYGASRLDAFIGRLAMIMYEREAPSENDVEDLELLQHLVEDVILLSADHRFIVKVDKTKSFQAPFVRSPWEVLTGLAPPGPPWGPSAMEAWYAHSPRRRKSLGALEAKVRASLSGQ